jgi:septum formation protein
MKIILGSASPRRRALLELLCPEFETVSPDVNEKSLPGEMPEDFVRRMSGEKMRAVLANHPSESPMLAITSDTIVAIEGRILGKPADHDDALRTLALLGGRTHRVITALSVCSRTSEHPEGITITDMEITEVTFRKISIDGIRHYLSLIEFMDKAGSYAIQEHGGLIVESVSGSLSNVIGFPLRLFFRMLSEMKMADRVLVRQEDSGG